MSQVHAYGLELIGVGKKQRALETLFEVITARRHRTWTKTHEPLMEKFLELCVDLKKSQMAKDGLHQYKTISQTVSVKSLEDVIMKYLKDGEQRCSEARQAATNALVDIDDLEVLQAPERYVVTLNPIRFPTVLHSAVLVCCSVPSVANRNKTVPTVTCSPRG